MALQSHVGTLRSSVEGCGLFMLNVTKLRTSPATFFNSLGDIWVRGRVRGGNKEASQNFLKTAVSPPEKHNASLWRLNVDDCVSRRVWKEEGGRACDV